MASENPALLEVAFSYIPARILTTAAELALADRFAGGPRSSAEVAEEAGLHATSLRKLLRALTTLGMFHQSAPDRFELTEQG